MESETLHQIIEKLEAKKRDCIAFSKKYETRKMEDLRQYYEGANWALDFALSTIKGENENTQ